MRVLGIETSCDDSSVSVVQAETFSLPLHVESLLQVDQNAVHELYGGVVPELASRGHCEQMPLLVEKMIASMPKPYDLESVDAIAVTNRPGLLGSLLVGVHTAKALSYRYEKPLLTVHHLEGHIASLFLSSVKSSSELVFPMVVAIISGGHTNLYYVPSSPWVWPVDILKQGLLGTSKDDAAGEAFDKCAKMLGLGYPGGVMIQKHALQGDSGRYHFPKAYLGPGSLDFSFSGLKTAFSLCVERVQQISHLESEIPHLCASLQEAIVDVIVVKIKRALEKTGAKNLGIVGGVAANLRLRERLREVFQGAVMTPEVQYCTDNAAMIAAAGMFRYAQGRALSRKDALSCTAYAMSDV